MKFLTAIALVCVFGSALAEQTPVFTWGGNSGAAVPVLGTVSQTEFADMIASQKGAKTLVVFLENGLTTKDFTCKNSLTSKSCFARMQQVPQKNYIASVENAIDAIRSIGEHEYNSVSVDGKLRNPIQADSGKVVLVTFDDESDAARDTCLESHDVAIASIASQLGDTVMFMYTTTPSTASYSTVLKRERRETTPENAVVFQDGAQLLLYFTSLTITNSKTQETTVLTPTAMQVIKSNDTALAVTLTSASPLTFYITLSGGYFFMTDVIWNGQKFRSNDVYAPTDFSYFCGNLTLYGMGTTEEASSYSLKWNSLQFQAPFGYTTDPNFVFSDPWHCVGFFTGGILSGLLIVALLLTITFAGVCWMMDINTMDRFDDPKGKTITINASE